MEKNFKENLKEHEDCMKVYNYDTDSNGFIDICEIALKLMDEETGDTLDVATITKKLKELKDLIGTSNDNEELEKNLVMLKLKIDQIEESLSEKATTTALQQQIKVLALMLDEIVQDKADRNHTHNYAEKSHTHSDKMDKDGGRFTSIVRASSNTSYSSPQLRNVIISNSPPNSLSMGNGDIWIQYK